MSQTVETERLPQYRSISSFAILALLFGLASPLAMTSPLLLIVPLVAVFLALFALRQIAANAEILSGRGPALIGLFLGVAMLVYPPVRQWTRYELLKGHAQELAEAFLDLLQQGKLEEAHQLSQLKFVVPGPDSPPDQLANADKITPEDFDKFRETQSIKDIEAINSKFTYRFDAVELTPIEGEGDHFMLRYQLVPESTSSKRPFPMWISISRTKDLRTGEPMWKITSMQHTFRSK